MAESLHFLTGEPLRRPHVNTNKNLALLALVSVTFLSACGNKSDSSDAKPKGSTRNRVANTSVSCRLEMTDDKSANCAMVSEKIRQNPNAQDCMLIWEKTRQSEECDGTELAATESENSKTVVIAEKLDTAPDTKVTVERVRTETPTRTQPSAAALRLMGATSTSAVETKSEDEVNTSVAPTTVAPKAAVANGTLVRTTRTKDGGSITSFPPAASIADAPRGVFVRTETAGSAPIALKLSHQDEPTAVYTVMASARDAQDEIICSESARVCQQLEGINEAASRVSSELNIANEEYKTSLSRWASRVCSQDRYLTDFWSAIRTHAGGRFTVPNSESCRREMTAIAVGCSRKVCDGDPSRVFEID